MTDIDWSTINTVLLDMDGTLLDLYFDNFFWLHHLPLRYSEIHEIDHNEATTELHQQFNQKKGTLNWYCLDYWSEQLDVDIIALKKEIQHFISERPFTREFLSHLKEQQIQRILVTNAHPHSLQLKLSVTSIATQLDQIISSHQYHAPKESSLFWQQLQNDVGFDPETTLFIDDSEEILTSAKQFGIAQLICIRQPDSRQPPHPEGKHSSIIHFNELLPQ